MRVFLLTARYLDLEIPIIEEIKRQGHEIFVLNDEMLPTDSYQKKGGKELLFVNPILSIYNRCFRIYERYWARKIEKIEELSFSYDLFICIQGQSFHPYLLRHLRKVNPMIKTCLYIWDTNEYYNFVRNIKYFDKRFSFDLRDCVNNKGLLFLPFYWVNIPYMNETKYDISIIGSDHDGRFEIIDKLYSQIKKNLKSYFIKVVITPYPFYRYPQFKIKLYRLLRYKWYVNMIEKWNYKKNQEFTTIDYYPYGDVEKIIAASGCILDTDRECQFGTTPRMIWALAFGKKVITTNKNIAFFPFFNEKQIKIIDRNNPTLDWNFITSKYTCNNSDYIDSLRIDRWINNFILF